MKTLLPHILLVGNDSAQAELLAVCIDALGILPIGPAATAPEALALYETSPDLVIINAALGPNPGDNVALAQQLLALRPTPIIFLTETIADAARIRQELLPQVVCVTKPYTAAYLQRVVQVVLAQNGLAGGVLLPEPVANEIFRATLLSPHLFVRERGMLIRLEPALIACVETESKYCLLTMASGHRHTARVPLRELLGLLAPAHFVRAHRSWMVNLQYIDHIDPAAGTIHLIGGVEVPLGRAHREAFFKQLRLID
ncbi:MAG: response regulator transcription factor [Hymenobacteraceae bacterium]|nr:response regulator transcription factor [Hymenobacteraceae bacterium]